MCERAAAVWWLPAPPSRPAAGLGRCRCRGPDQLTDSSSKRSLTHKRSCPISFPLLSKLSVAGRAAAADQDTLVDKIISCSKYSRRSTWIYNRRPALKVSYKRVLFFRCQVISMWKLCCLKSVWQC
ncbi:hypothetical protein E2C01_083909 [Portunus trituberculatus]|uniref:Uncharacterized protein n=1 Tax=Portunus trituberculatus TaxID=210409 RepID=A0A5B7ITR4_PORTR|nr:hypothetical protein [Portunus trituberculatus]